MFETDGVRRKVGIFKNNLLYATKEQGGTIKITNIRMKRIKQCNNELQLRSKAKKKNGKATGVQKQKKAM